MTAFAVSAARRALVEQLRAHPALAGVHVQRGLPVDLADVPDAADRVYVLDVRDLRRDPLAEQGARSESFDVMLRAETATFPATARDDAEGRLYELLAAVDDAIEGDDLLGGFAAGCALTAVEGDRVDATDSGWVASAVARVGVQAPLLRPATGAWWAP